MKHIKRNFKPMPQMQLGILGVISDWIFGDRAANAQQRYNEEALKQTRELIGPFQEAGASVLDPLVQTALAGPNFDRAADRSAQDIMQLAAARGGLFSGGTLAELQNRRLEFEDLRQSQRFGQLYNLATMGANAAVGQASQSADLLTGIGATRAARHTNLGNSIGDALDFASFLAMGSDARLKDNVEQIGTIGGYNLYRWDWNDAAKEHGIDGPNIGVMAQEIPQEYVTEGDHGYLLVNYVEFLNGID